MSDLIPKTATAYHATTVSAPDGVALHLSQWLPQQGPAVAHVLVLHGYMEHGGRYREFAHHLCSRGIGVSALDFRGHGKSPGRRGFVDVFDRYLDDVAAALQYLQQVSVPCFIFGHSHGGLIALDFVVARAPSIGGCIVTNAFLSQTHPARGVKRLIGEWAGRYLPKLSLPSGLRAEDLSHDPLIVDAHRRDSYVFHNANASWFREVQIAQRRVKNNRAMPVPLLYIYSDADEIALPYDNKRLAEQLESPDKQVIVRQGEFHEVLNELHRAELHHEIAKWIVERSH